MHHTHQHSGFAHLWSPTEPWQDPDANIASSYHLTRYQRRHRGGRHGKRFPTRPLSIEYQTGNWSDHQSRIHLRHKCNSRLRKRTGIVPEYLQLRDTRCSYRGSALASQDTSREWFLLNLVSLPRRNPPPLAEGTHPVPLWRAGGRPATARWGSYGKPSYRTQS